MRIPENEETSSEKGFVGINGSIRKLNYVDSERG